MAALRPVYDTVTFIETITFIQYVLQFYDILKTCNKISCYVTGYMCGSMCSVSTGLSSYIHIGIIQTGEVNS